MIRRPPRSTLSSSSAASDVYKRQVTDLLFQRVDDGPQCVVEGVVRLVPPQEVERLDLLGYELLHPVQLRLELRVSGEIPGHIPPFPSRACAPALAGITVPAR